MVWVIAACKKKKTQNKIEQKQPKSKIKQTNKNKKNQPTQTNLGHMILNLKIF